MLIRFSLTSSVVSRLPSSRRITPGRLLAIEALIRLADAYGGIHESEARALLRSSGALGGSLPWKDSIEMAVESGLVHWAGDMLSVSPDATQVVALMRSKLSVPARREILKTLINEIRPDILVIAYMDESAIRAFVEPDTVQCLVELGLLGDGPYANDWWESLIHSAQVADREYLKILGDLAEEHSFIYERTRLRSEGHSSLAESVRWVSRSDDSLGYDILSFAGTDSEAAAAPLRIEVKACGHAGGKLRFFLTRNEWAVGLQNSDSWIIHFWRSSDLRRQHLGAPYSTVAVEGLRAHMPVDVSDLASWTVCEVILPE